MQSYSSVKAASSLAALQAEVVDVTNSISTINYQPTNLNFIASVQQNVHHRDSKAVQCTSLHSICWPRIARTGTHTDNLSVSITDDDAHADSNG